MANVGFIGLGHMGKPMARNLMKAGHRVAGFDIVAGAAAAAGTRAVESASEAVRKADAVITMLPSGTEVRQVYLGEGGLLLAARPGTLVIDCSTIDVTTARQVNIAAAARGLQMIDAPVSGGVKGAEDGTLTFMVGGEESACEAARPFLGSMGRNVIHAGAAGNGQVAKICNNLMLGVAMIGVCEAFVLAEKLGLADQKLFDIVAKSSGQSWALTSYCPVPGPVPTSPANRAYQPGFTAAMMLKDLILAQQAAHAARAPAPLGAAAAATYSLFAAMGHGDLDFSGIITMLRGGRPAEPQPAP
ncbi:MAG: 3-hydroxyisobutyrate dehydrogenase [Alphaproteobacteria bacterium]|nr:3-hydroxyisobutyrate dehydrogenase [Alphaproteobacteria bacterium]